MFNQRFLAMILSIGLGISLLFTGIVPATTYSEGNAVAQEAATIEKGYGTEDRNWVTEQESLSTERYEVNVEENIEITARDGIIIRGRLLTPVGLDGPYPTVVQLNGYGHGEYGNSFEEMLIDLAGRGYAVLHVSMRGSGTSGGEAGLYNHYGEDGYDVIEWAADQSWSNGKVGTVGLSLLGISQWLAANELPPSLKAISPIVACIDCYEYLWYPGGMEAGPGRVARGFEYEVASEHRNFDDWWQERTISPEELEAIADHGVAALISGGWNDYISPGNVKAYELYSEAGGDSKLIMTPGAHAYLTDVQPYEFEDYQALWLDHYLLDEDNGVDERDPVLIYVQGADQWRYEKAWPIPDANYVDLYFNEKQDDSIDSLNDGSFTAKAPHEDQSPVSYSYSPETGPFMPSLLSSGGRLQIDQRPHEEKTVTWTSNILEVPTEVTGNMSVSFWAQVDAADADFVVQVTDVSPDGTSKQVTAGYLNASRAESRTTPEPLTPGEVEEYVIEILPTSYVFEEGHQIRLSISGGAKPLEGQEAPQGPGINPTASNVQIYQDADHPSRLTLPLIGVDSLKTTDSNETAKPPKYPDVKFDHWAFEEIEYLSDEEIIGGYPDGSFRPDNNTTRAEAAKMLSIALDLPAGGEVAYKDVSDVHWANGYIAAVTEEGLFEGYPDGSFAPGKSLTRAEMAKILVIAHDLEESGGKEFSDVPGSHWAADYISKLTESGIATGFPDDTFQPNGATTRAQYAVFQARALNEEFRE